jgi:hypothetical protein
MRTVGQSIRQARQENGLSLADLARTTKIKIEQLEALERDDYSHLPPAAYVRGFVKNIARVLDLNERDLLAILRRDYHEKQSTFPSTATSQPGGGKLWAMTPQKASFLLGFLGLAAIISYLSYNLLARPYLELESPQNKVVVNQERMNLIGKTSPNATLLVNSQEVKLRSDGHFEVELTLKPGVNKITVAAKPPFGRENRIVLTVFFEVDAVESSRYPE